MLVCWVRLVLQATANWVPMRYPGDAGVVRDVSGCKQLREGASTQYHALRNPELCTIRGHRLVLATGLRTVPGVLGGGPGCLCPSPSSHAPMSHQVG